MKRFILTIDSDTFIWLRNDEGLVYNSINYKSFRFKVTGDIGKICEQLDKPEKLYTVSLSEAETENQYVKQWIEDLLSIGSAIFKPHDKDVSVALKPMLKVQNDIKKVTSTNNCSDIADCLREVTFHLTGSNLGPDELEYHKQILYPIKTKEYLSYKDLCSFLKFIPEKENVTLNFIGDCDSYPYIKDLCALLGTRNNSVTFYFRLEDICRVWNSIHTMIENYNICLLCKVDENIKKNLSFVQTNIPNAHFLFLIGSDIENCILESIVPNNLDYEIIPIFTGKNQRFFSDYIYLDRQDCADIKIGKRYIFINQALNGNFYGKLEILPNGSVWDNLNFTKIGFIGDDFPKLLFSVFNSERAWFYNRRQEPCNHCLYQWLCPSPSNYELVLGRPNLCHIKT